VGTAGKILTILVRSANKERAKSPLFACREIRRYLRRRGGTCREAFLREKACRRARYFTTLKIFKEDDTCIVSDAKLPLKRKYASRFNRGGRKIPRKSLKKVHKKS